MSFIPDRELDEIRSRVDIVQIIGEKIPLKRSGRSYKGVCPFHQEKTPSFMVHPEKQIFHCFGCGAGGNVFSFLMKHEGLDFLQVVERLAEKAGVVLTRSQDSQGTVSVQKQRTEKETLYRINQLAAQTFSRYLADATIGSRARQYLLNRNVRDEVMREVGLGYAPKEGRVLSNLFQKKKVPMELASRLGLIRQGSPGDYFDFFRDRLIFPIKNAEGKIIGFSGRALEDSQQPKYLNSSESSIYRKGDSFLGLSEARASIREQDHVVLVEGNFDWFRLYQEGFKNVVAPLGTALTESQLRSLSRLTENFILLFDGDAAGRRAAFRSLEVFLPLSLFPKVVFLPEGEDPDTFVTKKGLESLRSLVLGASSLMEVRIEHIMKEEGSEISGQIRAAKTLSALLSLLPGEVERRLMLSKISLLFGIPEDLLANLHTKRGQGQFARNFVTPTGDDKRKFPLIEKTVLEVFLAGQTSAQLLMKEVQAEDFSHPVLGSVWSVLQEDFEKHQSIDVSRVLVGLPEGPVRQLLTELTLSSSRWSDVERDQVIEDCLRRWRSTLLKGQMKDLTQEIRQAERVGDVSRTKELLSQKSQLMKERGVLH